MGRAEELQEALVEVGRLGIVWKIATAHARCGSCDTRIERSQADVLLAEAVGKYEALLKSKRFQSEAPTMPKGRKKP